MNVYCYSDISIIETLVSITIYVNYVKLREQFMDVLGVDEKVLAKMESDKKKNSPFYLQCTEENYETLTKNHCYPMNYLEKTIMDFNFYKFIIPIANWINNVESKKNYCSPLNHVFGTVDIAHDALVRSQLAGVFKKVGPVKHTPCSYNNIDMFINYDVTFHSVDSIISYITTYSNFSRNHYFNYPLTTSDTCLKHSLYAYDRQLLFRKFVRERPKNYIEFISLWKIYGNIKLNLICLNKKNTFLFYYRAI